MSKEPHTHKKTILGLLAGICLGGIAIVLIFFARKISYRVPIGFGSETSDMWMMALVSFAIFSVALLYYLFLYAFMIFALFTKELRFTSYGIAIMLLFSLIGAQFLVGLWAWLGLIPLMGVALFFTKEEWQNRQKLEVS